MLYSQLLAGMYHRSKPHGKKLFVAQGIREELKFK